MIPRERRHRSHAEEDTVRIFGVNPSEGPGCELHLTCFFGCPSVGVAVRCCCCGWDGHSVASEEAEDRPGRAYSVEDRNHHPKNLWRPASSYHHSCRCFQKRRNEEQNSKPELPLLKRRGTSCVGMKINNLVSLFFLAA